MNIYIREFICVIINKVFRGHEYVQKKNISSITIQSSTTDNAAKKSAITRPAQKDPIENQGYAIMCPPIQNPRPLPIIPKLLSFRLAILGQYLPFHALVPRKRLTKERVPSRQSYDALIKNYHPPTTKGALARHSLSLFPSLDRYPSPSPSSFSFSFSSPTLRLLIYLALVPTKAKQAAVAEFTVEETWQTN